MLCLLPPHPSVGGAEQNKVPPNNPREKNWNHRIALRKGNEKKRRPGDEKGGCCHDDRSLSADSQGEKGKKEGKQLYMD